MGMRGLWKQQRRSVLRPNPKSQKLSAAAANKGGEEEAQSDEGQWVLEWGYRTANAGSELGYFRGGTHPPSPWPKPRVEQSWSGVLYRKRGVEQLSP